MTYYAIRGGSYDIVVRQEEGLVIWLVLGMGFVLGVIPRYLPRRAALLPLGALVLLALWTGLSLAWTESDERSVAEVARLVHYLGLLTLVWTLTGRSTWRPALAGAAAAAVAACAVAVASRLFAFLPSDPVDEGLTGPAFERLSYPFNYWNGLAAWGAMSIAMALAWSAHARSVAARAAFLAAVPLCATTVYLTYSRAGAIGTAVALVAVVAVSANRWTVALHALVAALATAAAIAQIRGHDEIAQATGTAGGLEVAVTLLMGACACAGTAVLTRAIRSDERLRLPRRLGQLGAGACAVVMLVAGLTVAREPIADAWGQFTNQPVAARTADPAARLTNFGGTRYANWQSARAAFDAHPIVGTGAGTFEFWWNRHGGEDFVLDAHSLYVEQAAELGVPGFILTVAFLVGLLGLATRARLELRPAAGAGAAGAGMAAFLVFLLHAGVDWMWEMTAVTALALVCVALAGTAKGGRRIRPNWRLRAGLTAVAATCAIVQVPGLLSTSRVRESQRAVRAGEGAVAFHKARGATSAAPWSASARVQRGLVLMRAGELAAAERDLRRAAELEPTNWRHFLLLARLEARRGNAQRALAYYRDARKLRPRSRFVRQAGR